MWEGGCYTKFAPVVPSQLSELFKQRIEVLYFSQPPGPAHECREACVSFSLSVLEKSNLGMMKRSNIHVPYCSAGDNSPVSLAIVQAGQKDQGIYYCCIKNSYGKVTTEFNLTAEGKPQLLSFR